MLFGLTDFLVNADYATVERSTDAPDGVRVAIGAWMGRPCSTAC
jgi:hypothetical protein